MKSANVGIENLEEKKIVARYNEETPTTDMRIRGAYAYGVAQGLMVAAREAEKSGQPILGEKLRGMARSYGI